MRGAIFFVTGAPFLRTSRASAVPDIESKSGTEGQDFPGNEGYRASATGSAGVWPDEKLAADAGLEGEASVR